VEVELQMLQICNDESYRINKGRIVRISNYSHAVSTIMDETHKVAITRLGERIRVADTAEIAGYSSRLGPHATDTVRHAISDPFPRAETSSRRKAGSAFSPHMHSSHTAFTSPKLRCRGGQCVTQKVGGMRSSALPWPPSLFHTGWSALSPRLHLKLLPEF